MNLQMVTRTMNIREFANFTKRFPLELKKMGLDLPNILAGNMQKSIRIRAPGRLKQTSVIRKNANNIQLIYPTSEIAKIANYVNKGIYPKHPIPALLMEASRAGKETAGRKSRDVLGNVSSSKIQETGGFVQPKQSTRKGFIDNAYNDLVKRTPTLIEKRMQQVFNGK